MIKLCQRNDNCNNKVLESDCNVIEMGWWVDKSRNMFTRKHYMHRDNMADTVRGRGNKGVFATVYRYNTDDIDNAYMYSDLYFDFDCKEDFEKVREDVKRTLAYLKVVFKIEHSSCNIYFSGNKGVHVTIPARYFKIEPSKDLNGVFKYIVENVCNYTTYKTLDLAIYDNRRLFRIPNTIHESTGLYKIPITDEEIKNLTYDEILELAKKPRLVNRTEHTNIVFSAARFDEMYRVYKVSAEEKSKSNIQYKATLKVTPPCIKNILETGAKEGQRNNTIAILASFYRNKGMDMNKAIEYISKWNNTKNTPPTSQVEVNRTIRSIFSSKGSYGCSSIKNITTCDESKCPLKKRGAK